ncbi:MAG TPA: hypothetical protein VK978_03765 [Candidatus Saccharimonadales bacterium]|nr:hypothetical protein [Candidatus Saccharimonadales bacterium]
MNFAQFKRLEFRRKFFRLFGAEIDITNPDNGDQVGFIEMQAWKLREDVRIYRDRSKAVELFRIHARSIIDFGATYDVFDSTTGEQLFSVRRQGLKSAFLRDHWEVSDAAGQPLGTLQETSSSLAIVRRYTDLIPFVGWAVDLAMSFWPMTYSILDTVGKTSATLTHQRNPFIVKFTLQQSEDSTVLDPRIDIALAALLSVVDAGKN